MTGTSMASPYVTGVVGLMLDANPSLTSAQCLGILQRTARPLAGASYEWVNDVGFGRIDPQEAIDEARLINARDEILGAENMKLRIFQSDKGDCLLLEGRSDNGQPGPLILCDGGMGPSMRNFVRDELSKLRDDGRDIDLAYISHIDNDHINGVLQLLEDEVDWRVFDFRRGQRQSHRRARSPPPAQHQRPAPQQLPRSGIQEPGIHQRTGPGKRHRATARLDGVFILRHRGPQT